MSCPAVGQMLSALFQKYPTATESLYTARTVGSKAAFSGLEYERTECIALWINDLNDWFFGRPEDVNVPIISQYRFSTLYRRVPHRVVQLLHGFFLYDGLSGVVFRQRQRLQLISVLVKDRHERFDVGLFAG